MKVLMGVFGHTFFPTPALGYKGWERAALHTAHVFAELKFAHFDLNSQGDKRSLMLQIKIERAD
tara:strand:- start:580 stop:771 length:192 start_codon:yes stop_codon:yes gene_type:complete